MNSVPYDAPSVNMGVPSVQHGRTFGAPSASTDQVSASLKQQSEETMKMAHHYIEVGIVIVKTHAPIFSPSGRVGCTCEAYRRSDEYRRWCEENGKPFAPNYICPNPGKHPVGSWKHETVGVTADQVQDTWGRFHSATDVDTGKRVQIVWNIGTLTGPSDLLTLDADTYKKHYQCDLSDLIDLNDQETPQAITHLGGDHFIYDRQGKPYTNANGELKAAGIEGVDIRGEGGFQVLAPSVGPSGNRYAWAEGQEPWTVKPRPIPAALDAILVSIAGKRSKASTPAVTFTTPTTARPSLGQWRVSKAILDLIHNPKPKGQRSQADFSVCLSLCYAGASDDDILSVFEHYPIGASGKFAETGRAYLGHTIANARVSVADHPRQDVTATIARVKEWAITADLSCYVADEHKPLRTLKDGTERAIYYGGRHDKPAIALVLDGMQHAGKTQGFATSGRQLVTTNNSDGVPVAVMDHKTALAALRRLSFMFEVNWDASPIRVSLRPEFVASLPKVDMPTFPTSEQIEGTLIEVGKSDTSTLYDLYKGDDAFLTGTARPVKQRMKRIAREFGDIAGVTFPELMKAVAPGLSTFAIAIIAALQDAGGSGCTVEDLRGASGASQSQVSKILRTLRKYGKVESHRQYKAPSLHFIVPNAFEEIKRDVAPHLKTYGAGVHRYDKQLERVQSWATLEAEKARKEGDEEAARLAEKRANRAAQKRFTPVAVIYPDMTKQELGEHIYAPVFWPTPKAIEAPAMPAPGDLAWERWFVLGNKGFLDADEYSEFAQLTKILPGAAAYLDKVAWNGVYA